VGFNNAGPVVTISPDATHYWEYWFGPQSAGRGDNHGAQYASADVKPVVISIDSQVVQGDTVVAFDQGKRIAGDGKVTYSVRLHNTSKTNSVRYNLQGGGFS
jgi:hypothetical protein